MLHSFSLSRGHIAVIFALLVGVAVAGWVRLGTPQPMPDAPVAHAQCVSYAPFRNNETPYDPTLVISEARIREDLTRLATFTDCVRTYSADHGVEFVPKVAKELGLKVLLGAWIGRTPADNKVQIDTAVALANQYPETVSAVIVGNEVLLRREQPADRLMTLIRDVRARVNPKIPVTYADVWEFWEQNPAVADTVDFMTIHILPYWEDNPVSIDHAIDHVAETRAKIAKEFPGHELLIGETGWPSAGREREGAVASLYNETRYVREFLARAEAGYWRYNLIEAFDQPWKRANEGTTGGFWGLFGPGGAAKVTLSGAVVEVGDWGWWLFYAGALGLALAGASAAAAKPTGRNAWGVIVFGGLAAGGALSAFSRHALQSSRTPLEWLVNGIAGGLAALTAVAVLVVLSGRWTTSSTAALGALRRVSLAVATVSGFGLVFDPRYRDFPVSLMAVAAVGFILVRLSTEGKPMDSAIEDDWLAGALALCASFVVINEGIHNLDALAWAAGALVLAGTVLVRRRLLV